MSKPRYLKDTDEREFETVVERTEGDRVVLQETLFYPEGGGQPHDEGTIHFDGAESRVTDVQKTDEIYHHLDGPPPEAGMKIRGKLDWKRRVAHMRYHTAQHLISAVLLSQYDAKTTGNQLYTDRARIDCQYDRFHETDIAAIESRVNEHIEAERPVTWQPMDRETAEKTLDPERTRLSLLPDSISEVRIVEIDGVDRTACAGTHVKNTAEIGSVSITGRETKGSEEERLRFVLD